MGWNGLMYIKIGNKKTPSSETNSREKIYDWFPISREPHWIIINVEISTSINVITSSLLLTVTMLVDISHFNKCSIKFTIMLQTVMFKLLLTWRLLMLMSVLRTRDWDNCALEMLGGNDITISGARDHKTQHCCRASTVDIALQLSSPVPAVSRHQHQVRPGMMHSGINNGCEKSHQAPLRDDDESADMHLTLFCACNDQFISRHAIFK